MNTTSFMDKQIMDLSQGSHHNNDILDLMNRSQEDEHHVGHENGVSKKEEILPNYDFQPIRPIIGNSFLSPSFDATPNLGGGGGSTRAWNSSESKSNTNTPIRNYGSLDSFEPAKDIVEKDRPIPSATTVFEIDQTMKKYADNLLQVLEGISARLTQLESRTRHLEDSMDDLKVSVGNNHGNADGKMRQLENILRDVQTGVLELKDKQAIVEAQMQLGKIQISNPNAVPQSESLNVSNTDSVQTVASAPQQSHQQLPPMNIPPSLPMVSPPNAPLQLMLQSVPPSVQYPNQFPQNQIPPAAQRDQYYPAAPGQTQEASNQQYQLPAGQQPLPPPTVPPHQQFQPTSQPQYSPPLPQLTQQHHSLPPVDPSQLQAPLGHHAEETPYVSSQTYPPSLRQPPPQTPSGPPPSQQYYSPTPNVYEPPPSRPNVVFSSGYGPPSGLNEPYHYGGSASQYGGTSSMKPQLSSASAQNQSGGSGYLQLPFPTARVLPHAVPATSGIGDRPASSGSGGKVPIDDVIDRVTNMGFPRDHVRSTVRKLTDNGQAVDLNVVLDKLMNDGDSQPPRGWYGR